MSVLKLTDRSVDLDTGRIVETGPGAVGGELRAMELKVLRYLAEHAGSLITHQELLTAVWGYSPRSRTRTVYSTWHRLRTALEADPTQPRHLVTVPGRGVRFVAEEQPTTTNLAPARDLLVGRTAELALLASAEARLVTVTGPGGVGKTRLAREHAWRLRERWTGVWFCDLANFRTAAGATHAVAEVLGVGGGVAPFDAVVRFLRGRGRTLLVLDNVESALAPLGSPGAAAPDDFALVVARLLDAVPAVEVLATSRDPVGVAGELRIRLAPLGLPGAAGGLDGEAVALLVDRVRAFDPAFDPRPVARDVSALVASLDGFPLAIEIAAGHAVSLGPGGVLRALETHRSLHNRRRDSPDRHRSLDAVVEWSWDRLPAWGRAALVQLTAFSQSFSLDGAMAVLDLAPPAPPAAEVVTELVERGLVARAPQSSDRFALFAAVRSFVGPTPPEACARHAAYYDRLAASVLQPEGGFMPEADPLDGVEVDEALQAAWAMLRGAPVGHPGDLLEYAIRVAVRYGRGPAGVELAEAALAETGEARVRVAAWLAHVRSEQGLTAEARELGEPLPAEAARLGLPQLAVWIEAQVALDLDNAGRREEAQAAVDRARRFAGEMRGMPLRVRLLAEGQVANVAAAFEPDPVARQLAYERAAMVLDSAGRPGAAAVSRVNAVSTIWPPERPEACERALLDALAGLPPRWQIQRALACTAMSRVLRDTGREAEAIQSAEEAVAVLDENRHRRSIPDALVERGQVRWRLGDVAGAEADARRALAIAQETGQQVLEAAARHLLGSLAIHAGDPAGVAMLERALDEALALGAYAVVHGALLELADALVARDRLADALDRADRVLALETLGTTGAWIALLRAELLRMTGDPVRALADARAAERTGGPRSARVAQLARAALLGELGLVDEARRSLPAPDDPYDPQADWARVFRARAAAACGEPDPAEHLGDLDPPPAWTLLHRAVRALRDPSTS